MGPRQALLLLILLLTSPHLTLVTWHQYKNPQDGSCGTDCPHALPRSKPVVIRRDSSCVFPVSGRAHPARQPSRTPPWARHAVLWGTHAPTWPPPSARRQRSAGSVAGYHRGAADEYVRHRDATARVERHRGAVPTALRRHGAGSVAGHHHGATNVPVRRRGAAFWAERRRGAAFSAERRRSAAQTIQRQRGATSVVAHHCGTANVCNLRGTAPSWHCPDSPMPLWRQFSGRAPSWCRQRTRAPSWRNLQGRAPPRRCPDSPAPTWRWFSDMAPPWCSQRTRRRRGATFRAERHRGAAQTVFVRQPSYGVSSRPILEAPWRGLHLVLRQPP